MVDFLKEFIFTQIEADKCVFYVGIDNEDIFLPLYVDDGMLLCRDQRILDTLLTEINKQFEITVEASNYFVGLEVKRNRDCCALG